MDLGMGSAVEGRAKRGGGVGRGSHLIGGIGDFHGI